MRRPSLTDDQAAAVAGLALFVARADGREPSGVQGPFVRTVAAVLLRDAPLTAVAPHEAVPLLDTVDAREFAAELAILTALVDPEPDPRCVAAADAVCRSLQRRPENLEVLHEVAHRRIWHARHHLFRRFLVDAVRTGSFRGDLAQLGHLVHDPHDHPEQAEPYRALADLPSDTLGRAFHDFYVNRGFPFPGEKGALPVTHGFEVHDTLHLLSGYNTDPPDEINVMAFQAGATASLPWLLLVVNLVTFNNGLAYGPTRLLHYSPHVGNLDPVEFVRALDRGLACRTDLAGDFDLHAAFPRRLVDVRADLGLALDVPDVRIPR